MQYREPASQGRNGIILGRPCPQLDQALVDLTRQLAGKAEGCGHTLIIIDHREELSGPFDQEDIQPASIDFGGAQRLNPLEKGFFDQPRLAALCLTNSVYRHATAWGERLRNTIASQAEVAWLYNHHVDTATEDQLHPANCEIIHDTSTGEAARRSGAILETARHQDLVCEGIVPNPALATVQMVNAERHTSHSETVAPMRNHLHNLIGNQAYRLAATQPALDLRQTLEPGRITLFNVPLPQLGNAATLISNAILQNALHLGQDAPRETPLHVIVNDAGPLCLKWDEALSGNRRHNVSLRLRTRRLRDFHAPPAADRWGIDDLLCQLDQITAANLDHQDRVHIAQQAAEGYCSILTR